MASNKTLPVEETDKKDNDNDYDNEDDVHIALENGYGPNSNNNNNNNNNNNQDGTKTETLREASSNGHVGRVVPEGVIDLKPIEGKEAWLVVLGSFLMHFTILGALYSYGVYVVPYSEQFGVGRADATFGYTVSIVFLFLGGLFTGRLADMYGIRPIFGIGICFWVAGFVLASFANDLWVIIVCQGGIAGLGQAFTYWPAVSIVPQWFGKRRAFALGVSVLGAGAGNLVFGVVVERVIEAYGFRVALRGTAGIGLALLLITLKCLRRRLPTDRKGGILGDRSILKERNYRIIVASGFLFQWGFHIPFSHLAAYIEDLGIDSSFAGLCVGLLGAGSALGRLMLGFIADKIGRVRAFQLTLIATGIVQAFWPLCETKGTLVVYAIAFGFVSGGFIALVPVVVAEYFGTARLGGMMGYLSIALVPGSLGGPPLAGLWYDEVGTYTPAILVSAAILTLAGLTLCLLSPPPETPPED